MSTPRYFENLESLIVDVIAKDDALLGIIKGKVAEALGQLTGLSNFVATQVEETVEAVFEQDSISETIEDTIKAEIKRAIVGHFRKG